MNIPDEAVKAAMNAWLDRSRVPGSWSLEEEVRDALEAAAPHLMAQAWDEGAAWTNDTGAYIHDDNPYRKDPDAV